MKRLGNIWNDVINVDLVVQDIIDATKYKRGKREVKKLLYDKDVVAEHPELWHQIDKAKAKEYAKYLVAMLSRNGEPIIFPEFEESGNNVILRRNFKLVEADDEFPAHYEWEEWQMTKEQYEVYQNFETLIDEQSDALVELADMISEVM